MTEVTTAGRASITNTRSQPDFCPVECYAEDVARAEGTEALIKGADGRPPVLLWKPPAVHSYGAGFDPAAIPRRQWLLGNRRAGGEVTVDVGGPGAGKSNLLLNDAVAIATGRALLADKPYRKGDVLILVGEDSRRDVEAKLAGILTHYRIQPAELGGRLHIVYLAEVDPLMYSLAKMVEATAVINRELLEWVRQFPGLVAAFIDPIAAWHGVLENDIGAMKLLCTELRRTAVTGGIHIGFDHHITKVTMTDPEGHVGNLAAARGAYIAADARWAFTLARLREHTAEAFAIPKNERWQWRRLDTLKASYGPDAGETRLLKLMSVTIANGETVGVLSEADARQVRADALQRMELARAEHTETLARALTAMLEETAPRSAEGAAGWLQSRHPELFPGRGRVLSTKTIRERLPALIGRGINTTRNGRPDRIVCRTSGTGKGARWEIAFAQIEII